MVPGSKRDVLRNLTFGNQVAEEEKDELRDYFVKTQAWDRIYNGEIDIIYGPKGSGKSAIYVLVQDHLDDFFDRNILLVSAENPQGAPAFKDLETDPPTSERDFIAIWKLYFLSLLGRAFHDFGIKNEYSEKVCKTLEDHGLLPSHTTTLGAIIATVRKYIKRVLNPKSIEGGIQVDQHSGLPTGVSAKILFEEPDINAQKHGFLSVDELLGDSGKALEAARFDVWFVIDRLDVAFNESSELERNALRALFRAYRDFRSHQRIKIKVFIRTDIWKRISEQGFREATHLSRDVHLTWNKPALQNLIMRRLLHNQNFFKLYGVDKAEVLSSTAKQEELFGRVFPGQVEKGEKQSTTVDWILRRTSDGTKTSQPRDVIFFLNKLIEVQNQRLERGEAEPEGEYLFDRASFKDALPALSEYRVIRVLYAEYEDLRRYIDALREQKTEQNGESLARIWDVKQSEALEIARELRDVGFFEEHQSGSGTTFWVPFVYRPFLSMSQGKADEIQGPGAEEDE